jgi:outer membrane protein assembly factor BamB
MSNDDLGAPWPVMRGNPQNTGRSPLTGKARPGGRQELRSHDTWGTINATPVLGPGDVIFVGSANDNFYVFDPHAEPGSSGNPQVYGTENIIDSAACILARNRVFFASGAFTIFEIDPASRAIVPISLATKPVWSPSSIAWLEANIVSSKDGRLYAGCDNFYMYCVDPGSGDPGGPKAAVAWATLTGLFIWSACAFSHPDQARVYFTAADNHLYALDAGTGAIYWSHDVGNLCTSSPAFVDGTLLFGCFDGKVYAVRDGGARAEPLWEFPTGGLIYASPAVAADGTLYIASSDGVLYALDTLDVQRGRPRLKWAFFLGLPAFSSAAIGPDPEDPGSYLVYVGSGNGLLYALEPGGRRRWSFDISTLEHDRPDLDPAFWPLYRYPAINSSVAAGLDGIATATSGGKILYAGYGFYRKQPTPPGVDLRPQDDYYADLAGGPQMYYVSPAGVMSRRPASQLDSARLFSGQPVSFRALARQGPDASRSGFEALDTTRPVSVKLDGQDVPPGADGASYFRVSADRTTVHVFPELAQPGQTTRSVEISASAVGGREVKTRLTADLRRVPDAPPLAELAGRRFAVNKMAVWSPFVIPALDQVGIASIEIPVTVLAVARDAASERFVAYGYESFGKGSAKAPVRQLRYLFQGQYREGNFSLEARDCYFELTAIPAAVDRLRLSGTIGRSGLPFGAALSLEYRPTKWSLLRWLLDYVTLWRSSIPSGGGQEIRWLERVAPLCERLVTGELVAPWQLLDRHDGFVWMGTYSTAKPPDDPAWDLVDARLSWEGLHRGPGKLTLTAKVLYPQTTAAQAVTDAADPVVGIVLHDDAKAIVADYSHVDVEARVDGREKTLTATLWIGQEVPAGTQAVALLGLRPVAAHAFA